MKESTRAGNKFYMRAMDYLDELKLKLKNEFSCSMPVFKSGEAPNVISETCYIAGSIRSFVKGLNVEITNKFTEFLKDLVKEGFKYKF